MMKPEGQDPLARGIDQAPGRVRCERPESSARRRVGHDHAAGGRQRDGRSPTGLEDGLQARSAEWHDAADTRVQQ